MVRRKDLVAAIVRCQVELLLLQRDTGSGKASLAELRRGVGRAPGEMPRLWGCFLSGLPEEMMSKTGQPTRSEWAVYAALTLFSHHQQGQGNPMHQQNVSLGEAVAGLLESADDLERIWRRLNMVAVAGDMPSATYHLRNLVQLLRSAGIALDYGQLAADLYEFQAEETVNQVRLRWGQSFFHTMNMRFAPKDDQRGGNENE